MTSEGNVQFSIATKDYTVTEVLNEEQVAYLMTQAEEILSALETYKYFAEANRTSES